MKNTSPIVALFLVILLGFFGPVACGSFKRFLYEGPGRDDWQKPLEVVAALELEPGDHVADLGSGGGYFTYPLAEAVGISGKVYAVDVDESLLAYVASQAKKRGLTQIEIVHSPQDGMGLPDGSVDMIFLSNVFHHLPDPIRYFKTAGQALRPGGRLAVVELIGDSFPKGHATDPEDVQTQLQEAGYRLLKRLDFLERQSFQIFALQSNNGER